jgi:hypothetical protein
MNPIDNPENAMQHTKTKRDQFIFEIRKQKSHDIITAKRMKFARQILNRENEGSNNPENANNQMEQPEKVTATFSELMENFADALQKQDFQKLHLVVKSIRIKISVVENPPIEEFVNTGLFPYLIKLLDERFKEHTDLQNECLWVISNTLSGNSQTTKNIFSEELVNTLMKLVFNSNQELAESVFE